MKRSKSAESQTGRYFFVKKDDKICSMCCNYVYIEGDEIMKLYYDKRLSDPTYYAQQGIRNGKATGVLKQKVIVTFSRKTMEYQRMVRNRQIERARILLATNDPEEIKKGPNDVKGFMKRIAKTKAGETVQVSYILDETKILKKNNTTASMLLPQIWMIKQRIFLPFVRNDTKLKIVSAS